MALTQQIIELTKVCTKCHKEKPINLFRWKDKEKRYRHSWCNSCRYVPKPRVLKNCKICNSPFYTNKPHIAVYCSEACKNIGKKQTKHNWYEINKEQLSINFKEFRKQNPEIIKKRKQKYNKENRNHINKHCMERRQNDIPYYLACVLRSRLKEAIKNNQKIGSAIVDLGCLPDELKLYLETLFEPGMTWKNHGNKKGQWSIDHIQPILSFNLQDKGDWLEACHWTNLQPLWNKDHIKKTSQDILKEKNC